MRFHQLYESVKLAVFPQENGLRSINYTTFFRNRTTHIGNKNVDPERK
jgi:hypothetical protein